MKLYGLQTSEIQEIKNLLQNFFGDLEDAKAYIFGSRSKGTHQQYSDIDIAIKSKSLDVSKKIALFKEAWEKSKLPYKIDITTWKDLYTPYLPEIQKTKKEFWKPDNKIVHPWRACPYGEHWVVRHPRLPVGRNNQDVDGHCRKNPSGKDRLEGNEINFISETSFFQEAKPLPLPYNGKEKIKNADEFDVLIAGWCKYWNDVLKPDKLIEPNFIKALMESESRFDPSAMAKNKKVGSARGLIQLTEETWKILKNRKGEIKDHYIDLDKNELFEPSKNICASIRWLFRKREILQKRLSRSPDWVETIAEYKGLGPDLKKDGSKSKKVLNDFIEIYKRYQ